MAQGTRKKKNNWSDHYTKLAKKEKYPARSVYKLKEIQKKHKLLKKGQKILDLGSAPGSWLSYAAQITGPSGRVIGVDIQPVTISLPEHVRVITASVLDEAEKIMEAAGRDYNGVISDMAPATTGNRNVDCARSLALCTAAHAIAQEVLASGGFFIAKIFQGEDAEGFARRLKNDYNAVKRMKPDSSRKASREIFMIGIGKK